ncbi:putative zinc finger, CCHC-type containing protein [Tanacetum coccineum]
MVLQDDCDLRAMNIVLQGISPDIYALVNHNQVAKQIWDRVKLLMQGTELSYQERVCKLYNEFDKFDSIKGEILHDYYMRFAQLINDIHIIGMTMQQVQVNTKFLNGLQPEWSKFVTNVKLAKSMYTTNYDQLYAYLSQHKGHANEVRLMRKRSSSNLRNQATVQDGSVIVQQVQGRQSQGYDGNSSKSNATALRVNKNGGNNAASQVRIVMCYSCQGEGHMARQCTQPKRSRNSAWFDKKLMRTEAQEFGQVLDEEQLAFLADPRITVGQDTQTTMPINATFQTNDLDAFDSYYDEAPGA